MWKQVVTVVCCVSVQLAVLRVSSWVYRTRGLNLAVQLYTVSIGTGGYLRTDQVTLAQYSETTL